MHAASIVGLALAAATGVLGLIPKTPAVFISEKSPFNITGFNAAVANGNATWNFNVDYWVDQPPATCTGTSATANGTFDTIVFGTCTVKQGVLGTGLVDWTWNPHKIVNTTALAGGELRLVSRYMVAAGMCQFCAQEGFRAVGADVFKDGKWVGEESFSVINWVYSTYTWIHDNIAEEL